MWLFSLFRPKNWERNYLFTDCVNSTSLSESPITSNVRTKLHCSLNLALVPTIAISRCLLYIHHLVTNSSTPSPTYHIISLPSSLGSVRQGGERALLDISSKDKYVILKIFLNDHGSHNEKQSYLPSISNS